MPRIPLKRKRHKLRRGRVIDRDYLAWMHGHPCLVAVHGHRWDCSGAITVHHVREHGSPKDDHRTLTLCQAHHLAGFGPSAIHKLGKAAWQRRFGIDIEADIRSYNDAYGVVTRAA